MRSLWASVVEDPATFKKVNGWLTVFWIAMVPVSILLGWLSLVEYISALSIYAIVMGHLSTYAAARVEVRQERQEHGSSA